MSEITAKFDLIHRNDEWAVILAGGDGTRLKSLTRKITLVAFLPADLFGFICKQTELTFC